jgi:hypothetical protein
MIKVFATVTSASCIAMLTTSCLLAPSCAFFPSHAMVMVVVVFAKRSAAARPDEAISAS